jgi:hypothetical protein
MASGQSWSVNGNVQLGLLDEPGEQRLAGGTKPGAEDNAHLTDGWRAHGGRRRSGPAG